MNWNRVQQRVKKAIDDIGETIEVYSITKQYSIESGQSETPVLVAKIVASIQPTDKNDLPDLPEGLSEKEIFTVLSIEEILLEQVIRRVDFDNKTYKVMKPPKVWAVNSGNYVHYESLIYKVEDQTWE